jgi:predicted dehydrogenase
VVHRVAAVGSRTLEKAETFVNTVAQNDPSIKAYGSYGEVYANENVDVVYIGTPHTHHYVNALSAIKAKKHVLCEKPVTSNAAELRCLLAAAKEYRVFFMEAMWTRFHPLTKEIKRISEEGSLGAPVVLNADLSLNFGIHSQWSLD